MMGQVELSCGTVAVLDTAGAACQAGVFVDGAPRALRRADMVHGQAEELVPMLQAVLAEAGVGFEALTAVVATVGPGSFTGLRVGLAAAHGLGLAVGCPVLGVSSLAAWANALRHAHPGGAVRIVLDSRRGDTFVQDFAADGRALGPPTILPLAEAMAVVAGVAIGGDLVGNDVAPSLADVFAAALPPDHRLPPQPLYLRPADAVPQAGAPRCA